MKKLNLNSKSTIGQFIVLASISSTAWAQGTITITGPAEPLAGIKLIPIAAGSSVIVETVGDGLVQYSCQPSLTPVAPTQHWICNENVIATDGNGASYSIPAKGEGGSKFDAFNGLIANCNQQVSNFNQGQPYVLNQLTGVGCANVTPNDAGLNCQSF